MSEKEYSSLHAALRAAKNIGDRDQWLSGDLRQMLDAIPAIVFVAEDVACSSIYGNAAAEALLRAPRNANVSKSAIDAPITRTFEVFDVDGVLIPVNRLPIQRAACGEVVTDVQLEVRFADGAGVFMHGSASPLRDENDAVWGAIGVFTDISSWKRQERQLKAEMAAGRALRDALQASEERYRGLANSAPAILWVADAKGMTIGHNEKWSAYTGQTPEQGRGEGWMEMIHPDDIELLGQRWRESLTTSADFASEHRIRRASDGAYRWNMSKASLHRDALGRPQCWFGTCVDIEDSKHAEAAWRASEHLFRSVFENAFAGMAMAEGVPNGAFLRTNDRLCEMLGYGPGELAGRTFTELTHPDDRQLNVEMVRAILAGEIATYTMEKRYLRRDGAPLWAKVSMALMRDDDNKPTFFIGSMVDISDLKHAEQALRLNEKRYRLLIESNAQVVFETDPAGELVGDLRNWQNFSGQTSDQCSGQGWVDAIHPDDRDGTISAWKAALASGEIHRHEHRVRRFDGVERWVSVTATPVRGADGQIVRWSGMISDITERRQAEGKLRLSEERLRLALKGAQAGAWQWNIPTGETIWSPETFGLYERDPQLGAPAHDVWWTYLHPDDLERTQRAMGDAHAKQTPELRFEFRLILPSGKIRWIEALASCEYATDGTPLRMFGISLDITDRKRAELRLSESEARFRAAQEASLDGFLIYEPVKDESGRISDLKIIYANPIASEYCLSTPDQVEGRLIGDLLPNTKTPGGFIERTCRIVESGVSEEFIVEYDAEGIVGYFRNLVVPFGRYAAVTVRDDTLLVQGANALRLAKAEAERASLAKSKFLAAASHDLRQPVQSLVLLMAVMRRQVADKPKVISIVDMAEASIQSLNDMLTGILDLSRLEAGVIAPVIASVDLGEIVSRLASEYRPRAATHGLGLRGYPRDWRVRTDAGLLERILRNLLENALRYTAKGGILIAMRQRGDKVRLDIIDTGLGIPAGQQAEIFEEFRQLDNPARDSSRGLGLGLAIVARLASLLGTQVEVSSRLGRGTRFSLLLPRDHGPQDDIETKPAVDNPGGRILVIDDNAMVRRAYEFMLAEWGYEVVSAETGEEALARAEQDGWRFAAIVVDHRLGAGLTGTAAAAEISRRAGRAIPTLVVTGDTAKERLAEVSASGFGMLHKPVQADELRRKLASLAGPGE